MPVERERGVGPLQPDPCDVIVVDWNKALACLNSSDGGAIDWHEQALATTAKNGAIKKEVAKLGWTQQLLEGMIVVRKGNVSGAGKKGTLTATRARVQRASSAKFNDRSMSEPLAQAQSNTKLTQHGDHQAGQDDTIAQVQT